MPKVTPTQIIFDKTDWLACLAPNYETAYTDIPCLNYGNKITSASCYNPYRHLGYAAPGFSPADATNVSVIDAVVKGGAVGYESATNYAYLVAGTDLHQFTIEDVTAAGTLSNAGVWPHQFNANGVAEDIVNYTLNDNTAPTPVAGRYMVYSFNITGGAWDIGTYKLDGSTFNDNWFSTDVTDNITPSGASKPHPLVVGDDDVLYVGDGNKLHGVDGQVGDYGTCYDSVLTLPTGYTITSFARIQNYLVIFAFYNSQTSGSLVSNSKYAKTTAKAFFWDYLSLDPTFVYDLDDNYVSAGFEYKGTVGCITGGRRGVFDSENRWSRLKIFDGQTFNTVQEFIGDPPIKNGVDVVGDTIIWNGQGIMYQYGSPYEGQPVGMNKIGKGTTGTTSGMLKVFQTQQGFVMSSGTTTSGGLEIFKSNYAAVAGITTAIAEPVFPEGKIGKVRSVTVHYGKTSNAGRGLIFYIDGNNFSATQLNVAVTSVAQADMVTRYTDPYTGTEFGNFEDLRLILLWSAGSAATDAPVVKKVVVDYELVNIKQ